MKKLTSIMAVLLAAAFLSPLALAACTNPSDSVENSSSAQSAPPSSESVEEDSSINSEPFESVESESEESQPPESEDSETDEESSAPPVPDEPSASTPPAVSEQATYIRCTGDSVNIRSGAGTEYTVLGSANEGTMYAVIGKTGNWYKTYYRNKTAYIYAEYASVFTLEKAESEVENVVAEGYKLIGVPYVYGAIRLHDGNGKLLSGFSAQKFDCSSLIQYIFYKGAGELLNVNTRTQVTQGEYVKKNELRRGDCIFFTNEERQYKTGIERIGHVALYLGNDYILHTSSDYARIEKMSAKRWAFYVEARRFL